MHFSVIARWVLLPAVLLAGVLIAVLFCINLPWFDEELHPDLVRLASPKSFLMEGNALPWMYGIHAADDQDPLELGQEIVLAILNRARRNETRALTLREMYEDRGMIYDEAWKQDLSESRCEEGSDCLGSRRTEEVAQLVGSTPRLRLLLERYDSLIRSSRYQDLSDAEPTSFAGPAPDQIVFLDLAGARLAFAYRNAGTEEFLAGVASEFSFWRLVLDDADSIIGKMVALTVISADIEYLSALVRNRKPNSADLQTISRILTPFSQEERNLGEMFRVEMLGLYSLWDIESGRTLPRRLSWFALQKNATANELYTQLILPMTLRASLSAEDWCEQEAYQPIEYRVRAFPPPLFNLSGKSFIRKFAAGWKDILRTTGHVHDVAGRMSLVSLQAEIARNPEGDVATIIRSSTHRDPYTQEPMLYNAGAGTIGFECRSFDSGDRSISIR